MLNAITAEEFRSLVNYDPSTGIFTWKVDHRRSSDGYVFARAEAKIGRQRHDGYWRIRINRIEYLSHRLAFLWMTGEFPKFNVDHKNGNTGDNRYDNLRDVTQLVNNQNKRRAMSNNKSSGMLGVTFDKSRGKFAARIKIGDAYPSLGRFDTAEAAHAAYLAAKRQHHAGCTI